MQVEERLHWPRNEEVSEYENVPMQTIAPAAMSKLWYAVVRYSDRIPAFDYRQDNPPPTNFLF
jgi:hypothetical protein